MSKAEESKLPIDELLYQKGYEQAEKDLALTWGDIEIIHDIMLELRNDENFPPMSVAFYKEILRRFNEIRNG